MTYDELQHHIANTLPHRIPQALYEMNRTWPLVHFLNHKYGLHYDQVVKDEKYENDGVDTIIVDSTHKLPSLYIQLTRANEYDMSPGRDHTVDISGKPILNALGHKCAIYEPRGIMTPEIILLIDGITPGSQMYDLVTEEGFMGNFREVTCFAGVYYASDLVFELLPLTNHNFPLPHHHPHR